MENNEIYDLLPRIFFTSLKQKMILGILPSETAEDILKPLLKNYRQIMPKLPLSLQKDIKTILKIYPEIAEEYRIKSEKPVQEYLAEVFFQAANAAGEFYASKKIKHLAVLVILVIATTAAIFFKVFFYSGPVLAGSDELIHNLSEIADIHQMANFEIPVKTVYGFTDSDSFQKKAFYAGFYIACLNLALAANHSENIADCLLLLKIRMKTEKHVQELIKQLEDSVLNKKNMQTSVSDLAKHTETLMKQKSAMTFYRTGEWCAIFRSVLLSENKAVIKKYLANRKLLETMQHYLKKEDVPPGVFQAFENIIKISNQSSLTDMDIDFLSKEIERIIILMG